MHSRSFFVFGLGLAMFALADATDAFYTPIASANITGAEEIIFNSTEVMVNPSDAVEFNCGIKGHIGEHRYCIWTYIPTNKTFITNTDPRVMRPDEHKSYQVQDIYQGVYSGKGKPENETDNQCGIILKSVKNGDNGLWKCSILFEGGSVTANRSLIVTVKPQINEDLPRTLNVDLVSHTEVKCTVGKARPPATITWTLNDKDITNEAKVKDTPNVFVKWEYIYKNEEGEKSSGMSTYTSTTRETGDTKTVSTLSHKFTKDDKNATLKCKINHPTLENPEIREMTINVGIAPSHKDEETFYNIKVNTNHTIKLQFDAKPKPFVHQWKIGEKTLEANSNDEKFITSYKEDIENGKYEAELRIFNLTINDYEDTYTFKVENEIATAHYNFKIARHEGPLKGRSNSVNSAWLLYTLLSVIALLL